MGASCGFQRFGNNTHLFHLHKTFPLSLLLDICKSSIYADLSLYLMYMKPYEIYIEIDLKLL
jgi:hypothetical protein